MTPLLSTLFQVLLAVLVVVPPFLLGRATRPARPGRCTSCRRRLAPVDRARHNGAVVARHREEAAHPVQSDQQAVDWLAQQFGGAPCGHQACAVDRWGNARPAPRVCLRDVEVPLQVVSR